jgi:hypothetical protein
MQLLARLVDSRAIVRINHEDKGLGAYTAVPSD